jgi:hypothetical protein
MLCSACKNKSSNDRCTLKALKNLKFCGKHAKSKAPRLWAQVNEVDDKITKIQKLWRGWIVRYMLSLAGPGVLKKSLRHNEEDVITYEQFVRPIDYFAFEEDGKVFWFDIRSIFQMSIAELEPINPYTRCKLTLDTRKRIKECVFHRGFRNLPLFHDTMYLKNQEHLFAMRWMLISQMLEESLSIDVNPMFFIALNTTQLIQFTAVLKNSLYVWARQHNTIHSRRNNYHFWMSNLLRRGLLGDLSSKQLCHYIGGVLLKILKDSKTPHDFCFKILSARYNL